MPSFTSLMSVNQGPVHIPRLLESLLLSPELAEETTSDFDAQLIASTTLNKIRNLKLKVLMTSIKDQLEVASLLGDTEYSQSLSLRKQALSQLRFPDHEYPYFKMRNPVSGEFHRGSIPIQEAGGEIPVVRDQERVIDILEKLIADNRKHLVDCMRTSEDFQNSLLRRQEAIEDMKETVKKNKNLLADNGFVLNPITNPFIHPTEQNWKRYHAITSIHSNNDFDNIAQSMKYLRTLPMEKRARVDYPFYMQRIEQADQTIVNLYKTIIEHVNAVQTLITFLSHPIDTFDEFLVDSSAEERIIELEEALTQSEEILINYSSRIENDITFNRVLNQIVPLMQLQAGDAPVLPNPSAINQAIVQNTQAAVAIPPAPPAIGNTPPPPPPPPPRIPTPPRIRSAQEIRQENLNRENLRLNALNEQLNIRDAEIAPLRENLQELSAQSRHVRQELNTIRRQTESRDFRNFQRHSQTVRQSTASVASLELLIQKYERALERLRQGLNEGIAVEFLSESGSDPIVIQVDNIQRQIDRFEGERNELYLRFEQNQAAIDYSNANLNQNASLEQFQELNGLLEQTNTQYDQLEGQIRGLSENLAVLREARSELVRQIATVQRNIVRLNNTQVEAQVEAIEEVPMNRAQNLVNELINFRRRVVNLEDIRI